MFCLILIYYFRQKLKKGCLRKNPETEFMTLKMVSRELKMAFFKEKNSSFSKIQKFFYNLNGANLVNVNIFSFFARFSF